MSEAYKYYQYGLDVVSDIKDTMSVDDCAARSDAITSYNASSGVCYNSTGETSLPSGAQVNATKDGILGVAKITTKLPLIMTVVLAAVMIGILLRYMVVRRS